MASIEALENIAMALRKANAEFNAACRAEADGQQARHVAQKQINELKEQLIAAALSSGE